MGTDIIITAALPAEQQNILLNIEKEILDFEQRFSRFISNNELSNFNNSLSTSREVSKIMLALLQESQKYYFKTNKVFDPTIISSLKAVGYDKNFNELDSKITNQIDLNSIKESFIKRPKMSDLKTNENFVECSPGFQVDFGGIGKGYIVDLICQKFLNSINDYWISAGGDIKVSGHQNDNLGWEIGVQNPSQPEQNIFTINTKGEELGIATSGIIKRHGLTGDYKWHHLIDPRTGLSVENEILSVTAISSSAIRADIFAKTVLILGETKGLEFIEQETDSACIIFTKNNKQIFSKRAGLYLN